MHYFAYGSNLWYPRMRQRVGPLPRPRVATLDGYGLRWHKRSRDGSGKCDIVPSPGNVVHGAIYELAPAQLATLDDIEGVGNGYRRDDTLVAMCDESRVRVVAYVAEWAFVDDSLVPYDWYRDIVVAGARALGFPAEYISTMERQRVTEDPVRARALTERAVLERTASTGA